MKCLLLLLTSSILLSAQSGIPQLKRNGSATQLTVDNQPFLMLGGELNNSSASSLPFMKDIWPRMSALNVNTILATVSWELLEPEEGKFDFTLVDGLINGARAQHLRLVFLWFGSWKNGVSTYAPLWVKTDLARFPRQRGRDGKPFDVISPLSEAARNADAKAFAALMRHIKEIDGTQHTVVMMQVENEVGLLGDSRDRSDAANAAWAKPVPAELASALKKSPGTWSQVFGDSPDADEIFQAWNYARYINYVAEAGKREYPIPMFANAWLVQYPGELPGLHPSGGPVAKVMAAWKAGAPAIDFLAPDIYLPDFRAVCEEYSQSGNALFIPEAMPDARAGARGFYAIGRWNAMGFSPFGIDGLLKDTAELKAAYGVLSELSPLILAHQGKGTVTAVLQQDQEAGSSVVLGGYKLQVEYPRLKPGDAPQGYALIIATGKDEFIAAGAAAAIRFTSADSADTVRIGSIDEGRFVNGKWTPGRRLNGDENGGGEWLRLPNGPPDIQKIRLYRVR